ncbi:TRAP transporter large permease [Alkalibacter saccharofermentans]|uniref:TRAP transporter, DctM subunit n=1 Tax=Alkalibacter saccharofermentans DSM 14828 TaxID=1120975 RepID=A0A1M4TRC8_9FIRM|nr:TRAP transporter large permease [Alkalibacter saccharofermentans]SHE47031.1 TRAP transporter, DctM subunit [Alkalibacter saccharofermentans DSM 14828]
MTALLLFVAFIVLIFFGLPVAFSLGVSSLLYLFVEDISLSIVAQRMYSGIDSFTLVSIPGFILAGNLMNTGGITKRIIAFANAIFGFIRGGLSLANIGASMLFAGISGTALADTASIGAMLIPAMKEEGYEADFAAAVTASSSTVGPIIPPSLPMIIAGTLTGISVGKLFIAGAIPGIILGLSMMVVSYIISVKRGHPKGERKPLGYVLKTFKDAVWAIGLTVLILYGILSGAFTPTEASIIAVVYAVIVGKFIYKDLKFSQLPGSIIESVKMSAAIMILVGFANLFAWILASEQIPQMIARGILSISTNKIIVILLINLLLLFVGTFMETIAALIILFPVLLPVATSIGLDPIQFGVMAVLNLVIGLTTPPVGVCLFVASSIGDVPLIKISKAVLPFLAVSLAVLMLVSFVPAISLFLPSLFN